MPSMWRKWCEAVKASLDVCIEIIDDMKKPAVAGFFMSMASQARPGRRLVGKVIVTSRPPSG